MSRIETPEWFDASGLFVGYHATPFGRRSAGAIFSNDRKHRFLLWRDWRPMLVGDLKILALCMLNPSIAAAEDDPTIRKVRGFAERIGCNAALVVNRASYIATDPRGLGEAADRNELSSAGPNEAAIRLAFEHPMVAERVVAWGRPPSLKVARALVKATLFVADVLHRDDLKCWGKTAGGDPRHPLMLTYATPLEWHNGHGPR